MITIRLAHHLLCYKETNTFCLPSLVQLNDIGMIL